MSAITNFENADGLIVRVTPTAPLPTVNTAPSASSSTAAAFVRGTKAPAATGTPEALAADGTYVQTVTIVALRTGRVANTSSVWIDSTATNDAQLLELIPGAFVTLTAPPGKVIDLNDIYVDSTTLTDGVFFWGML